MGSAGGAIATANKNVTLSGDRIRSNILDNCNLLNAIPGCVG
jgi:hypothetical protein